MKIKTDIQMYEGYANLPSFNFEVSGVMFDPRDAELMEYAPGKELLHIPAVDGEYDLCEYQTVVTEAKDGNTNYAWGAYPAGWSTRAGIINVAFNKQYMDCRGTGLDIRAALDWVHENYSEPVAVCFDVGDAEIEYDVVPWEPRKDESIALCSERYQVMNPTHPDFVDAAMEFLQLARPVSRKKTCYQCQAATAWLAPDARCSRCTNCTPDEV